VSLLSRIAPTGQRVLIGLSPAEVAFARLQGLLKPKLVAKRARDCDPAAGAEPWHGAVESLRQVAAEVKDLRCDVTVVLSNHFVRYALVPASETLAAGDEQLAFARYCFAKVHGERAKAWDVRLSGVDGRSARVASAIDSALLEAVRACFPASARARLVSVQPYLMAAFNRSAARKSKHSGWLLLLEPQRACLACIDGGRWTAVRNVKGAFELPEQWAELLDRERYLAGAAGADVIVHAPRISAPAESGSWRFHPLSGPVPEGYSPLEDRGLAMALCAG
jgi:hypothetical protein